MIVPPGGTILPSPVHSFEENCVYENSTLGIHEGATFEEAVKDILEANPHMWQGESAIANRTGSTSDDVDYLYSVAKDTLTKRVTRNSDGSIACWY